MQIRYDSCRVSSPAVALTFDDGPHPEWTPKLLDMLGQRGVRATFYVIGRECEQSPEILRRTFAEGHEIGNHTWTHPFLTRLGVEEANDELARTSALLSELIGRRPPTMRPPFIDTNEALERMIDERFGMKVIGANVGSRDWTGHAAALTEEYILSDTVPGSIILCHDPQPNTTAAMPRVLDTLLARGFQFVTVSELLTLDERPRRPKIL